MTTSDGTVTARDPGGPSATRVKEMTAEETMAAIIRNPSAVLVDVRTEAERRFVGVPDIDPVVFVEWSRYPEGDRNPQFIAELAALPISQDAEIYFLCRSGARSAAACRAAAEAGYRNVVNVSDGFEGPLDAGGRRCVAGWKVAGLPWRQT